MHWLNHGEIASIFNWLTLSDGREHPLTLQVQYLKFRTELTLDGSLVACQAQNARKDFCFCFGWVGNFLFCTYGKFFIDLFYFFIYRKLKRISVSVVERETCMSASYVPNIYEIFHTLCLVSAFTCIGVSDGLFHKLWWIHEFCNIANVTKTVLFLDWVLLWSAI